ncbi:MAG TPA: hypothetical protein VFD26_06565 [Methyloceanibacter sp.]|nr:hypothetical protein [Methyloceanibacter sp.]
MSRLSYIFAATLIGAAAIAAQPAAAQDFTTATYGGTTIWAGGGVQFLSLPDIRFTGKADTGSRTPKAIGSTLADRSAAVSRRPSAIGAAIA